MQVAFSPIPFFNRSSTLDSLIVADLFFSSRTVEIHLRADKVRNLRKLSVSAASRIEKRLKKKEREKKQKEEDRKLSLATSLYRREYKTSTGERAKKNKKKYHVSVHRVCSGLRSNSFV